MDERIDALLAACGGVTSRRLMFKAGITRATADCELRTGALVRVMPRAYCRPWQADSVDIHERAALMSLGMPAALSHLSTLRRWELLDTPPSQVHATVPARRCIQSTPLLVVHRANRFPPVVRYQGLVTVTVAHAVASSWPLLAGSGQRDPAIKAVRKRLISPAELRDTTAALPRLEGRRSLLHLCDLLAAGCESELEVWGYLHVFQAPGLDHAVRQKAVRIRGRSYRLDLAYEEEGVAVELDGDRYHSSNDQRERDRVRDAALASVGWVTLRFSHDRLHRDVAGCRRDTRATLAARRALRH